jgi:hypothetical protein
VSQALRVEFRGVVWRVGEVCRGESLRHDVDREMKLLEVADDKYRALMIQHDIMLMDNERLRRVLACA